MNHRADEVHTDLLGGPGAEDVSPELLAFLQRPRIGALIDRDGTYQESCPLGVLELSTFLKVTSI